MTHQYFFIILFTFFSFCYLGKKKSLFLIITTKKCKIIFELSLKKYMGNEEVEELIFYNLFLSFCHSHPIFSSNPVIYSFKVIKNLFVYRN